MQRKALITGANGFIGSALCRELSSRGYSAIAVVRNKQSKKLENIKNIRLIRCDLSDICNLEQLIDDRDIDVFYHLAWTGSAGELRGDYETQLHNVKSSCDAVKVCAKLGCKRFVFASSIMEYEIEAAMNTEGIPTINTLYSSAKLVADYMARTVAAASDVDYIRAVISNVYGPGEINSRLVNSSIRKMLKREHCSFSSGEQMYDFIYITDAVKAFCELGEKGKANRTYYIGSLNPRPLKDFLLEMRDCVAPETEIGLGELPFNGVSLNYDEFDINAVRNETGFVPEISFAEGIRQTADYIKKQLNAPFKFTKLPLDGAYVIENFHAKDKRGGFTKIFEADAYKNDGICFELNETFTSVSHKNVIRGLHFQTHKPQAKMVSVLKGKVWDVIVDLRVNSPTYRQWFSVELSAENHKSLFIPRGFAHGFVALEDGTIMLYQCDGAYDKESDTGIRFDAPEIGIKWPIPAKYAIHSERDLKLMSFAEYEANPIEENLLKIGGGGIN